MTTHEAAEVLRLRAALDRIMTGGNSLASVLVGVFDAKIPPYETDFEVARNKIKDPDTYDLWLCWAVMMRERDALAADPGPLVAAVEGLVRALEPFERFATRLDSPPNWVPDGCPINTDAGGVSDFSVGQLREARAAIAAYRAALGEVNRG